MTVLVTRPSPDGEALCEMLSHQGIQAIHLPLIRFTVGEGIDLLHHQLVHSDIVIAVSKPAVDWADQILQSCMQAWPSSVCYLAIGQKTADKLSEVTAQKVHYPEVSDSEHLLQLAPLLAPQNSKVTILRGNGGRELIGETLIKRNAVLEYCEVYQRQMMSFDGQSEIKKWKKNSVTQIVITSGEQLEFFFQMIPVIDREWLFRQMLVVPSKRISHLAQQLGFRKVTVSGGASNPELAAVLLQQCTTGQAHEK